MKFDLEIDSKFHFSTKLSINNSCFSITHLYVLAILEYIFKWVGVAEVAVEAVAEDAVDEEAVVAKKKVAAL